MQKLVKRSFPSLAPKSHRPMQFVASAIALLSLISLEITTLLVGATPALAAPISVSSYQDRPSPLSSVLSMTQTIISSTLIPRTMPKQTCGLKPSTGEL